jgi:hypothetical protein
MGILVTGNAGGATSRYPLKLVANRHQLMAGDGGYDSGAACMLMVASAACGALELAPLTGNEKETP